MSLRTLAGLVLVCIPVTLGFGCSDDSEDTSAEGATDETNDDAMVRDPDDAGDASSTLVVAQQVDASGATLRLDTLVLIIPPGAIDEEQVVTLQLSAEGSQVPSAPYSQRFDIEPEELTLALAATVELTLSGSPMYPVLVVHAPGKPVSLIPGAVVDRKFTAPIGHFGSIYLADAAELAQSEEFANDSIVIGLVGAAGDASVGADAGTEQPLADAGLLQDAGADAQLPATNESLDAGVADAAVAVDAEVSTDPSELDAASGADAAPVEPLEPGAVPPQGYLASNTGPFASLEFDYFYLEDFEDHELNQPGVTASSWQLSSSFDVSIIDSVDGDDGNPSDNQCVKLDGYCDALWAAGTVTFTFNADELGGLPTHAGAVWTDGEGMVGFEAFGLQGEVIYAVEPFSEAGFPGVGVTSDTAEDRFFGVYSPDGVTAIRLYNTSGGIEVDHLQYGREPQSSGQ